MKRVLSMLLALGLLMQTAACAEGPEGDGAVSERISAQGSPGFSDVPEDAWYARAVGYCTAQGLMDGVSPSAFSPDAPASRAVLVTALYRRAGSPAGQRADFTDIPAGSAYRDAAAWAAGQGIAAGYGDGRFGGENPVTREQFAAMLWRAEGRPAPGTAEPFADQAQISGYAADAAAWAKNAGVINGRADGRFDPKGNITRGEAAVMLFRWLNTDTGHPAGGKALVAYFSATGTTRVLAEYAAEYLKADLYEIVPETPYTDADLAYYSGGRADREQSDPSVRPAVSGGVEDMAQYGIVLLGYPIWHGQAPRIVSTFLESYDLDGKTIVPFCTSHSSGIGSSDTDLHVLAGGARWLPGRRFAGGTSRGAVEEWIGGLDLPGNEASAALPYDGVYPQHAPYGRGIGAMPGRVVWAHDPDSVDWDGTGDWWEPGHFDEAVVRRMVDRSIASLGGEGTARSGWTALFRAHNGGRGRSGGYVPGEKIAIKANINGSAVMDDDTSGRTRMSYTNPVLLKALLLSLVEEAGAAPSDITVYDVSRLFPDYMVEMCTQGRLRGVRFVGRNDDIADESAPIVWSHAFSGRVNYLPTCVTEAEYVINFANLKGHSYGITLCGKNHFGSFINGNRMRPPEGANLHQWLTRNEMGIYSPLVDLMANADLGGKTVLYMLDALICAPSEGAAITGDSAKWQQAPFCGDYTASVFVSQDPVAIDSVGADFLINEPAVTGRNSSLRNNPTVENYLHEAGLVSAAPSGTAYTDGRGHAAGNLGVHEHWNNSAQKRYSRNLGEDEGIELIALEF